MADECELVRQFCTVFGERGGDLFPGNVGPSLAAPDVCYEIMNQSKPLLYDYFIAWERRDEERRRPLSVELHLMSVGQWEARGAGTTALRPDFEAGGKGRKALT